MKSQLLPLHRTGCPNRVPWCVVGLLMGKKWRQPIPLLRKYEPAALRSWFYQVFNVEYPPAKQRCSAHEPPLLRWRCPVRKIGHLGTPRRREERRKVSSFVFLCRYKWRSA
eukprot:5313554-Amphidinium_carterae.1